MVANGVRVSDSMKELVLQAGLELLDEKGLSLTFDSISYARVFEHLADEYGVTVTRGSVHERIWAGQDDFRRDVLAESVLYFPTGGVSSALLDRLVSTESPEAFVKDIAARVFPEAANAPISGRFQSVKALASWFDDPEATGAPHQLLDQRAEAILDLARSDFPYSLAELGLRPRPELGLAQDRAIELFWVLVAALTEGSQLNLHAGSFDTTVPVNFRSGGPDSDEPWQILSVGLMALVELFFEPSHSSSRTRAKPARHRSSQRTLKVDAGGQPSESRTARRPRAQLRKLVLTAAVELLLRDGPNLKPDLLNYASVFAHLKRTRGITVHRSSVHRRIWASNDEFRNEVLIRSLSHNSAPIGDVTDGVMALEPAPQPDGSFDSVERAIDMMRIAAASLPDAGSSSMVAYRRLLQIKTALIDQRQSEHATALRAAVAAVESQRMDGNKKELSSFVLNMGFRVRPERGLSEAEAIETFEVLTMTTAAGTMLKRTGGRQRGHQIAYGRPLRRNRQAGQMDPARPGHPCLFRSALRIRPEPIWLRLTAI